MRFAKAGADVNQSSDYKLLFAQDAPALKPLFTQTVTVPDFTVERLVLTHNLGYIPAFQVSTVVGGNMYPNDVVDGVQTVLLITNTGIYSYPTGYGGSATFHINIFAWEIGYPFESGSKEKFEDNPLDGQKYAFIHAKQGESIKSNDLRDFAVNTTAGRMPLIHKSGLQALSSGATSISHDLGYEPDFLLFGNGLLQDGVTPGYYSFYPTWDFTGVSADSNSVDVAYADTTHTGNIAFIILKDYLLET